jgi:hypothetical protein
VYTVVSLVVSSVVYRVVSLIFVVAGLEVVAVSFPVLTPLVVDPAANVTRDKLNTTHAAMASPLPIAVMYKLFK